MKSLSAMCLLAVSLSLSASAQWLGYKTPGIPRTRDGKPDLTAKAPRVNGKPDLSGVWHVQPTGLAEMKRLLEEAGASIDPAFRKKNYSAAIKRATEEAYWLPLHTYVTTYGYTKTLNFTPYPDELPRFYLAKWK